MIQYLKDIYNSFLNTTKTKKVTLSMLLVFYIVLILLVTVKVNYVVITPGVINDIVITDADEKVYGVIEVETNNKSGKVYTVGVYSHMKVSYFQYLISKISNDINIDDYDPKTDLSEEEEFVRGVIHKDLSITNALIVAYQTANKIDSSITIDYSFEGIIVSAVAKYSKSYLKPGDLITKVNGIKVTDFEHFRNLRNLVPNDEFFKITVIRDNKEKEVNTQKVLITDTEGNSNYVLGIEAYESYKINEEKTFPKYSISESIRSVGPSGGAMMTLAIYNSLLTDDVTKNKFIVGTGTIDINGKVGDIGGVSQKISTAALFPTDIFFVNPEDYDEAKKKYDEIKPSFKLVRVETFDDILIALRGESYDE